MVHGPVKCMMENELISSSAKGICRRIQDVWSCNSCIARSCFAARYFIRQVAESRLGQPRSQALSFSSLVDGKRGNEEKSWDRCCDRTIEYCILIT